MSYRMCALCNCVVDNRVYNKDTCPDCDSSIWADPTEFNNEWELLHKLQREVSLVKLDNIEIRNLLKRVVDKEVGYDSIYIFADEYFKNLRKRRVKNE